MKNIILDLDGTLIDSSEGIYRAFKKAATKNDMPVPSIEIFRSYIGPPIDKIIDSIYKNNDELVKKNFCDDFREQYDNKYFKKVQWYENVVETLKTLKSKGYKLYIVTNKPTVPSNNIIKDACLEHIFEYIIGIDYRTITGQGKRFNSKCEALQFLKNMSDIANSDCLYIGDTANDQLAAIGAQMEFVGVKYGYGTWLDCDLKAEYLIEEFKDTINMLDLK